MGRNLHNCDVMKRFTLLFFLLFSSIILAQDFIPMLQVGNEWNVDIYYDPFKGDPSVVTRELSLGDLVLINGFEYRQTLVSGNVSCLLREDNGFVYKYSEALQEEYLLFDFTLEEGDVFNVTESAYGGFPYFSSCVSPDLLSWVYENELHVANVDYVDIAGQIRKVISFEKFSSVGNYYWIEGIGNWTGFDLMAETVDISGSTIIACFTTNGETHFMFGATSCDNTLGAAEWEKAQPVLYPNPVTDISILHFPEDSGIDTLKFFDVSGRLVMVESISENYFVIDAMQYASGLYFYQGFSENTLIKTDTFIVK